jgi:hypothetical protein
MPTAVDLRRAAEQLHRSSRALDALVERARRTLTADVWRGAASDRTRDSIDEMRGVLHAVSGALTLTANELERDAGVLDRAAAPRLGGGAP